MAFQLERKATRASTHDSVLVAREAPDYGFRFPVPDEHITTVTAAHDVLAAWPKHVHALDCGTKLLSLLHFADHNRCD